MFRIINILTVIFVFIVNIQYNTVSVYVIAHKMVGYDTLLAANIIKQKLVAFAL